MISLKQSIIFTLFVNVSALAMDNRTESFTFSVGELSAVLLVESLSDLACGNIDEATVSTNRLYHVCRYLKEDQIEDFYAGFVSKFKYTKKEDTLADECKKSERAVMYAAYDIVAYFIQSLSFKDIQVICDDNDDEDKGLLNNNIAMLQEELASGKPGVCHGFATAAVNEVYGSVSDDRVQKVLQALKQLYLDVSCLLVYGTVNPTKRCLDGTLFHGNPRRAE